MPTPPGTRRGRGARAGLDRDRILEAARGLDPRTLTMQSVADALGVDRKALNYHVRDRESLLEMLAIDALAAHSSAIEVDPDADWRAACRAWATGLRDSIVATGALVFEIRFSTQRDLAAVGPAEAVLEKLLEAGFELETAARGMHLLSTLAIGFGRDLAMSAAEGGHPQIAELRRALAGTSEGLEALRALVGAGIDTYDDTQFEFDLAAFFARMDALRAESGRDEGGSHDRPDARGARGAG